MASSQNSLAARLSRQPTVGYHSCNRMKAICAFCSLELSVIHRGLSDVKHHVACSEHKKNDRFATTSAAISTCFAKSKTFPVEHQKVLAAEMTAGYHAV